MNTDPITQAEMMEMFGEAMPIEAVNLIWQAPGDKTCAEIRAELRQIAARRTLEETNEQIVDRLTPNWEKHCFNIGEPLKRLINCLNSGQDVNLSGIDRDLIVYALAFTQQFTTHQRS